MTRTKFVHAALAAVACWAAAAASTVVANAAAALPPGAILSVSPAHPDPAVASGKAYFVHSVVPGAAWSDQVAVVNTNNVVINAWVDAVDGVTSVRTGAVYSARTVTATGAGSWVRPHATSVTVAPHAQAIVAFTVAVPADALAGDHLAGIAFESKQGSSSGAAPITTVLRSVVAVQVRVPGPAVFQLHIYSARVTAVSTTGTSGIALDMEDIGGLLGKPQLEITLDGPAGYHRAVSLALDTMLPGDRITDEILWPETLGAGDYRLAITEDGSGRRGAAFATTAHLAATLHPYAPGPAVTQAVAPDSGPPWNLFGGTAGAGVTAVAVLLLASSRRRRLAHAGGLL